MKSPVFSRFKKHPRWCNIFSINSVVVLVINVYAEPFSTRNFQFQFGSKTPKTYDPTTWYPKPTILFILVSPFHPSMTKEKLGSLGYQKPTISQPAKTKNNPSVLIRRRFGADSITTWMGFNAVESLSPFVAPPMIELQSNPGSLIESQHNGLDPDSPTSGSASRRWSGKTFLACGCCFLIYMLQMVPRPCRCGLVCNFFLHVFFWVLFVVCRDFVSFFLFMKRVLSLDPEGSNVFRCDSLSPVGCIRPPAKVQVLVPRGFNPDG